MTKVGRRLKPENARLTQRIKVSLTVDEADKAWRYVARHRLMLSRVLRDCLMKLVESEFPDPSKLNNPSNR